MADADERSPEERRLYNLLEESTHAWRVVEERNKQLEEEVRNLNYRCSDARVVRIISEKEVRKWQEQVDQLKEQVEQLSRDLSKATCLEFPHED
jgi:predicted  nucleic acid-binding Zn-ribbon protein